MQIGNMYLLYAWIKSLEATGTSSMSWSCIGRHRAKLICLDEIQWLPEFFSFLRSEIDTDRRPGRFLILGSASRDLIRQSSETLAGGLPIFRTPDPECL